jgi:peptidoglycan/xylan/chitin deacetylase (PgdA/CDA1 family)
MVNRQFLLKIAKGLGAFALARRFTRRSLRILCYHGLSLDDEEQFQPKLFMRIDTFRSRMRYLAENGYPVLPLREALDRLNDGTLPDRAVVITFDDGWRGIGTLAVPVLEQHRFPATIYVTTRDVVDEAPVFNVAIRYLLWKSRVRVLDLGSSGLGGDEYDLSSPAGRNRALEYLGELADATDAEGRTRILSTVASLLGLDWSHLERLGMFRLMTTKELTGIARRGVDLQLHTHDHLFGSMDRAFVERTVIRNREVLTPVTGRPVEHFCFPSGEYSPEQLPWLASLGVVSATSCAAGFVTAATPRLELGRFLDGENIDDLDFEAELSGFLEVMRRLRARVKHG